MVRCARPAVGYPGYPRRKSSLRCWTRPAELMVQSGLQEARRPREKPVHTLAKVLRCQACKDERKKPQPGPSGVAATTSRARSASGETACSTLIRLASLPPGFEAPRSSIPRRPIARLDQGEEPEASCRR